MCGFVGVVDAPARPEPDRAARLLGTLAHRGPDAAGEWWSETGTWLGFRRLAILDLDARSAQPMTDEASGITMVFNGEIYNYVELRDELRSLGHRFRTTGDSEVLLKGFVQWGRGVFERCNGMFAAAFADPAEAGVLLARDRFGEKPLFVARRGREWWFASEVAVLAAAGAGTGRMDRAAALGFLTLGDIENPTRSYLDGVSPVPAGTSVRLTGTGLGTPVRWWDASDVIRQGLDGPTPTPEEVRAALDESVRLRLRSDVSVGTSLSGGVDSSAIVTSLRAVDPTRELHTFTASFPGQPIDEWGRAVEVGRRAGVEMHRVEPDVAGFHDALDDLVQRQGGPIEAPTVYAQWCVMRAARDRGVIVLLDGQGADETWGGYLKYLWFAVAGDLFGGHPADSLRTLRRWSSLGSVPRPSAAQVMGLAAPGWARRPLTSVLVAGRRRHLGPVFDHVGLDDPQGGARTGALLTRAAEVDVTRVLLPRLLRYADRNSMAWSRELRLPFLDPALVTLAARSDWAGGLRSGWTKALLREAVAPRLPKDIVWRREKTAYETPNAVWLRDTTTRERVAEAGRHLTAVGVLVEGGAVHLDPWRVLSLSRFLVQYGLSA